MAAITICSDFGAQKNKVSHCFHCFPIYFPLSDGAGWHKPKQKSYEKDELNIPGKIPIRTLHQVMKLKAKSKEVFRVG